MKGNKYYFFWILVLLFALIALDSKAKDAGRIISCSETKPERIRIGQSGVTVLSFLSTPKDVVLKKSPFDLKRIKNDLVLIPLAASARTNMFVYLNEKRCSFEIETVPGFGDGLVLIRDTGEIKYEVKLK